MSDQPEEQEVQYSGYCNKHLIEAVQSGRNYWHIDLGQACRLDRLKLPIEFKLGPGNKRAPLWTSPLLGAYDLISKPDVYFYTRLAADEPSAKFHHAWVNKTIETHVRSVPTFSTQEWVEIAGWVWVDAQARDALLTLGLTESQGTWWHGRVLAVWLLEYVKRRFVSDTLEQILLHI